MTDSAKLRKWRGALDEIIREDTTPQGGGMSAPRIGPYATIARQALAEIDAEIAGAGDGHASDCAIHRAPAYEPGPCDCGAALAPLDVAIKALEQIAAGSFQNASSYAVNGQWHDFVDALQEIAREALAALRQHQDGGAG